LQQSLTPDKPFFTYLAPGAVHAPHHVPKSYIDKWKGKFDEGWDVVREQIFERQKKRGVIPRNAKLARKLDDATGRITFNGDSLCRREWSHRR